MGYELKKMKVESYMQFKELVNKLNREIEEANALVSEEERRELLDEEYLLRRYQEISSRVRREAFIDRYDCKRCLHYEKFLECMKTEQCLLEKYEKTAQWWKKQKKCSKDKDGTCPYGNEVGTCFGFCMRDILSEMQERKRRYEKGKEETKDGG